MLELGERRLGRARRPRAARRAVSRSVAARRARSCGVGQPVGVERRRPGRSGATGVDRPAAPARGRARRGAPGSPSAAGSGRAARAARSAAARRRRRRTCGSPTAVRCGLDQALGLEEPDLGDGDVGEVRLQLARAPRRCVIRARRRGPALTPPGAHARGAGCRRRTPAGTCRSAPRRRSCSDDLVDPVAVDVGAVEAADVARRRSRRSVAAELGVPARDGHVVEEDVAVGVAAGGHLVVVEQEPGAGVGAALHDQQRGAGRQRVDGGLVGPVR